MARQSEASSVYDSGFFKGQMAGSLQSARRVVPVLLAATPARSVIDFGCGVGTWLSVFRDHGVERILGIDGDYVDRTLLQIASESFVGADLRQPFEAGRFDLAVSVEVAEHIDAAHADIFVRNLTAAADVVAFSAGIPDQGGAEHVNEQWPSYWAGKFAAHGYRPVDSIRPVIWDDAGIDFWYRQNLILFVKGRGSAKANLEADHDLRMLDVVHPEAWALANVRLRRARHLLDRGPFGIRQGLGAIGSGVTEIARELSRKARKLEGRQSH
jgi:SAM-dependent methyltransferase